MVKKVSFVEWQGAEKKSSIFKNKNNWEHILQKKLEKDNIVIGTSDDIKISDADYVVFFDNLFYKNLDKMWELYHARKLHSTVYIDYEPPTGHCKNHSKEGIMKLSKIFKNVITYNDDYIKDNIIKGNIADFYCSENKYNNDFKDRKLVAMVTNNTKNVNIIGILNFYNSTDYYNKYNIKTHKQSIYQLREKVVSYFTDKCPNDFDLYGSLWSEDYSKVLKGYIKQKDKYKVLSSYKFIVSFDSFVNQNGYISEKIFDCFRAKTVPIYLGANNVTDYIPSNCFIDMRDFKSFEELYNYLINVSEEEYNDYIKNIEEFLKSKAFLDKFSSEASANIIYDALFSDTDFSYEDAYKSLMYFQKKKDEVLKKRKINYVMTNANGNDYIQLEFSIYDYLVEDDSNIYVYIDNKLNNDIIIDRIVEDDCVYYKFVLDLYYKDKPIDIRVKYVSKEHEQWLKLFDFSSDYSNMYGLYKSRNNSRISYTCINNKHGINKLLCLLKYNKKQCIHAINYYLINLVFLKKVYRKFIKNNKVLLYIFRHIKRICNNIRRLPSRIWVEIKNIFV